MRLRPALLGYAFLLAWLPLGAGAQDTTMLAAGTRVRLVVRAGATTLGERDGRPVVLVFRDGVTLDGRLQPNGTDSISVAIGNAERTFALADVERLLRYEGRHTSIRRSTLIGIAGGVVLGAVIGAVTPSCWSADAFEDVDDCNTGASIWSGAASGAILGALGGLVVGAIPRARYEAVPPPWRVVPADR
jgi:hypothetical protein